VLPQAFPQLVAYTLYRWEVNIRASAVLGVVGAGGLGGLLHISLNLFHHHRTLTLLAVIVLLVTAVDLFSGAIRRRILEGPAARAEARPRPEVPVVVDAW
jgi:phosphonate transport system permease protein